MRLINRNEYTSKYNIPFDLFSSREDMESNESTVFETVHCTLKTLEAF